MIERITNHAARALSRVISQFRGKPRLSRLIEIRGRRAQEIEDVFWSIFTSRRIGDAEGAQIDVLGRIVVQPREAASDEEYTDRILAKIALNRSSGLPEQIYGIFRNLGVEGMRYELEPPAGFTLTIGDVLTASRAALFLRFLRAAATGGVKAILRWQQHPDAEVFTFEGGPGLGFGDPGDPDVGGRFTGAAN